MDKDREQYYAKLERKCRNQTIIMMTLACTFAAVVAIVQGPNPPRIRLMGGAVAAEASEDSTPPTIVSVSVGAEVAEANQETEVAEPNSTANQENDNGTAFLWFCLLLMIIVVAFAARSNRKETCPEKQSQEEPEKSE
jgi:hypothetical protein